MPDSTPEAAIRELAAEVAGLRDLFLRRLMEDRVRAQAVEALEQTARRAQRELEQRDVERLFRELLLVVDRVDAATSAPDSDLEDLARSVADEILEVLRRRGLHEVTCGETMDPAVHEVVGVEAGSPTGQVLRQVRPGFRLDGRLLRPAQVVIARSPGGTDDARRA